MKTTSYHIIVRWRPGRQQAFTRTELLAVVAVLAVLACLILPAFPNPKTGARRAACINNLRQLAASLSLYESEFHQYPTAVEWEGIALPTYARGLRPRLPKNRAVLICPERAAEVGNTSGATAFDFFSYGYNGAGTARDGRDLELGMGLSRPIASLRIRIPSEMITLADSGAGAMCGPKLSPYEIAGLKESQGDQSQLPSARHRGGANVLFCDGHVSYGKQQKWIEKTPEARRQWNNDNQPHCESW